MRQIEAAAEAGALKNLGGISRERRATAVLQELPVSPATDPDMRQLLLVLLK